VANQTSLPEWLRRAVGVINYQIELIPLLFFFYFFIRRQVTGTFGIIDQERLAWIYGE